MFTETLAFAQRAFFQSLNTSDKIKLSDLLSDEALLSSNLLWLTCGKVQNLKLGEYQTGKLVDDPLWF